MKALGHVVSDKKIFENCILKFFWPCDLLMQPTGTVWTILIGDHPGIIPVKFIHQVVSEEMLFKEIVDARTHVRTHARTMDDGQWAITKAHLEHFVLRWAKKYMSHNYSSLWIQTCLCSIFYDKQGVLSGVIASSVTIVNGLTSTQRFHFFTDMFSL